ncbi:MAG: PIN domain-containing protein [Bacteroidota bacterium]
MIRAVIDTNVLLASLRRGGQYRWLFDAILEGRVAVVLSTPIVLEYTEIITAKTTTEIAANVIGALARLRHTHHVEVAYRWRLIEADPDDDKFVDAAIGAGADVLSHTTGTSMCSRPSAFLWSELSP